MRRPPDTETLLHLIKRGHQAGLSGDPSFRRLMECFDLTGDQKIHKKLVRMALRTGKIHVKLVNSRFELPYGQEEFHGDIQIGTVLDTNGVVYSVPNEQFNLHSIVWGKPQKGKTVLLRSIADQLHHAGWKLLIIDHKGYEFSQFLKHGGLYLKWNDLRWNPLVPPEGMPIEMWLPKIAEVWADSFGVLMASGGYMMDMLLKTHSKYAAKGITPAFNDFAQEVIGDSNKTGRLRDYQNVVMGRVTLINNTLSPVLKCRDGFMKSLMNEDIVIYDISDLSGYAQNFIVENLLYFVFASHKFAKEKGKPERRLVILDEAQHQILSDTKQYTAKQGASIVEQVISLSRQFGLGIFAAAQRPGAILEEINSDASFRCALNLTGEEALKVARLMGLSKEQMENLPHLGSGVGIVRNATSGFTFPCIVKISNPELPESDESDWKRNEERIKALQASLTPYEDIRSKPEGAELPLLDNDNAKKLLLAISSGKPLTITEFYQQASLFPETGDKAKKELTNGGFIKIVDIPGAGRTKTAELSDKGERAVRNLTGKGPKEIKKTKWGGAAHEFWVQKNCNALKAMGATVTVACRLGGQEADIVADIAGRKSVIEICLTKSNLQEKIRFLNHADSLVYLVENAEAIAAARKEVQIPKGQEHRVEFKTLKKFLDSIRRDV